MNIPLVVICLLLLLHRAYPIDYVSMWQLGICMLVYMLMRILPKRYLYWVLGGIALAGWIEGCMVVLEYTHCSPGIPRYLVTAIFSNSGAQGGWLAISLLAAVALLCKSWKNKVNMGAVLWTVVAIGIVCGLILTESRAGWVAAVVGLLYVGSKLYPSMSLYKKGVVCLFVVIFIVVLYSLRPDSAIGRLFIWQRTWEMITDYPLLGTGTGGWLANYMYYQAEYFAAHPDSSYIAVADNVFYPYNEFLHLMAEQGLIGLSCLLLLLYSLLGGKTDDKTSEVILKSLLIAFIAFSCFSYPASVFRLQLLFACIIGLMKEQTLNIVFPQKVMGIFVVLLMTVLITMKEENFRYSPRQLFYQAQELSSQKYPADDALQVLEDVAHVVPTCELYCDMGDLWMRQGDFEQAKKCYQMAGTMIPGRLTPNYKLFLLYIKLNDTESAICMGEKILKQPIKKEGSKTIRMQTEVMQYMSKVKND
ncbi:MAG: O-antigen ligase family protein [Bacteroides sp.]|nr:O-antigen ligase family protein [Bacteroides sp.]